MSYRTPSLKTLKASWHGQQLLEQPGQRFPDDPDHARRFTVYTDIDRLEQHMLELSPADAPVIHEFIRAARRFTRFSMMDMLLAKPWEMLQLLPNVPLLGRWGKLTLEQCAERFSEPFLRRAFPMMGRKVVQTICKQDGRRFVTEIL